LKIELGLDFTFYLQVAFGYRNDSSHSTINWSPAGGVIRVHSGKIDSSKAVFQADLITFET
jgi:hypothetical protein